MTIPRGIVGEHPGLGDWCILHAWRGSIAHGMFDGPHPDSIVYSAGLRMPTTAARFPRALTAMPLMICAVR